MNEPTIRYETTPAAGGASVARLTFANPGKRNAVTLGMWRQVPDLVARAVADASVRVLALRGEGGTFCAGADISEFGDSRAALDAVSTYDDAVAAAQAALRGAGRPVVALVEGLCYGGGVGLALACDLRLAASDARFCVPAGRLGLGYAYDNVRDVADKIGPSATADLLFSARVVDAPEALRMGIATNLAPAESFEGEAEALLARIAANAPLTLAAVKRALVELARPSAERDRGAVDALVRACATSRDYAEGQAAFRERRQPVFAGR